MSFARNANVTQYNVATMNAYMRGVFRWMSYGLIITTIAAYAVLASPALSQFLFTNPLLIIGLCIAEVVLVIYITRNMANLSASSMTRYYVLYSVLSGVTLAPLLALYTNTSVVSVFAITFLTFACMALYGYFTKRDLTSWGSFLMMGLLGLIIASIVNAFLRSSQLQMILNYVGVLIFVGLTAYDVQKLRIFGNDMPQNREVAQKGIILGALTLYLDFINLFISLLQILGTRRD